jgi:hypothetical protein
MIIKTGQTVYELVRSFDRNTNEPVIPANFTTTMYVNGVAESGYTINIVLSDSAQGIYSMSWSANTYGTYQAHIDNDDTSVIYISEIYTAKPDSEISPSTNIYVGL